MKVNGVSGNQQIAYAEKIGLGSSAYTVVDIG
jgi:uncharacterized Fe-S center protein